MKKALHYLLLLSFLLFFFQSKSQQVLYQNNSLGTRTYNPGAEVGTPVTIFDDINFASSLTNGSDSVVISQVTVAIGRLPGSPATVVNVYASAPDTAYDSLNSLPMIPPKLIGTLNLPANGPSGFFTIGDNAAPLAAFKIDTGRFIKGYQTLYIGLKFSDTIQKDIGWYLSNGPDSNYDLIYRYNENDPDTPVSAINLSGTYNLPATFYAVVNGTFKNAVILPVVLNNLKVSKQDNGNLVEWQTQSENNADYFDVERSTDSRNFKKIGQVTATGYSNKQLSYQYNDALPQQGINFYRLRMVDKDNVAAYSAIVMVANQSKKLSNIYPNPVTNKFTATFNAANPGSAVLQIKNENGSIIYSKTVSVLQGDNSVTISDLHLAAGVYYVSINNETVKYSGKIQKL